ncbi:BRCA2-interacting transcriptional repressor EMSY isoform X1 [Erpetoichthys calabaricus]|uniref:BRCA2-interacting transcriptional repressor EMSY n=1 Tax=Erpetoichthys calabaricus TaxID=27687 RepID=A0A8C4SD84_ERPCA|nr:BRCA2-interacting transcriptional repressor EMSY isoform X1 [Erpetoichthys calabaricus]
MIQNEKPHLAARMPVVWPTLLDLNRDECKRILRKLELEAYAGVISALRAQGDLNKEKKDLLGELTKLLSISTERHRAEVRRAVNDERLTTIAYHMSGPNSSSEWSIEGRRLVPLMPRLVPQTAFTVTANAVANAAAHHNASLLLPTETGNKEAVVVCYSYTSTTATPTTTTVPCASTATVKSPRPASPASNVVVLPSGSTVYVKSVSCSDEDEKPRKRRRTNSSSSSPVVLKEVPKVTTPVSKTITVPVSGSPKMSNIMQSIANSLPPHMSPVKITFTKPSTQTTNTTTQKVIIVTTSPSSTFVPNILSKSHNYAAVTKLVSTSVLTASTQKQPVVITASQSSLASTSGTSTPSPTPSSVAVTTVVSSSPSVVMSTVAQGVSSAGVKVASARLPSPKTLVGSPTQILAQFPKQHQHSPKQLPQVQHSQQTQQAQSSMGSQQPQSHTPPGIKPTIQIKQESGVKIITQQVQPSKILPKPVTATLPSSSNSPIMVVSSNGAIMTTKLVSTPTGTQATYSRPTMSPTIGARMATSPGGATYVKTTSGSIITVVPKSLATLGGKIISSNIVSGTTTKITTIPMTSKPNVIVVQKTTGKGTTIQGLPGKNVVTTLLNAGGEKTLQAVPTGAKPAIITATRPITKMIVTQPKGMGSGVQPATKIIPTKIVYGQQGKTQVLIKPKPMAFQATVVSEQARQLVSETLHQVSRVGESAASSQEGVLKEEPQTYTECSSSSTESSHSSQDSQPVVHVITSRGSDWGEHEVAVESAPTIIYQDVSGESQSATSTIKALLELQQTTVKEKGESKPRQHTIDLSQMAVPIQVAQEKRQSPESPVISSVESDMVTEYNPSGKSTKPLLSSASISSGEMALTSLLSATQQQSSLQRSQAQTQTGLTPVVVKSLPTSSAVTVTRIMQQAVASQMIHSKQVEEMVSEEGEVEGDTLDPQTGLFYRSAQPVGAQLKQVSLQQEPAKLLPHNSQQQQSKTSSAVNQGTVQLLACKQKQTAIFQQDQSQLKPIIQQHLVVKERQVSVTGAQAPQTVVQVIAVKPPHTPQLPKLQQAPTSQNRPVHTQFSQPPPLQAHHPVSSEKQSSNQVQQPIITQGATVTKITFGSHQAPPLSKQSTGEADAKSAPVTSVNTHHSSEKSTVSDILKISMIEAQIDPHVEPMVVDSSSDCSTFSKNIDVSHIVGASQLISSTASSVVQSSHTKQLQQSIGSGSSLQSQFTRIQSLPVQKSKDVDVIQVIPQYSITPDSSQSNVVVEPSGFLEITNFTSQRLDDDTGMEQEVDSSNDEGTEASPIPSSADQS